MANPSDQSREELYEFLAHSYLPITEDGCFLGYKSVRENFLDHHSGKYSNAPGEVCEMPREDVDPNRHNHCSQGFHVGTMEYVRNFGGSGSRYVLVKVNPADAVSVPADHGARKLRCCRYEVVAEIVVDEVLEAPVYSADGSVEAESPLGSLPEGSFEEVEDEKEAEEMTALWWKASQRDAALEAEKAQYVADRVAFYEDYTRDFIVAQTADRGLLKTKEVGRRLGKAACVALLAANDVDAFFA